MKDDENRGKGVGRGMKTSKLGEHPGAILAPASFDRSSRECGDDPREPAGLEVQGVARPRHPAAKSDLADQIGVRLRGVYDDVLAQPVPDRFLELLRELETTACARAKKDGT